MLLIVLIFIVALGDGDGEVAETTSTTTTTVPTTTTTTSTTSAPTTVPATTAPTTVPPTTVATTTTTTVISVSSFALVAEGLEGPVDLLAGMSPDDANASGYISYPGPEFTVEADGYECGFGVGAGALTDTFDAMFLEEGLSRFYVTSPNLRTVDGLGLASTQTEVEAVLGPPTETRPEAFGPGQEHFYRSGDFGFAFTFQDGTVEFLSVGFYDALFFIEGCL